MFKPAPGADGTKLVPDLAESLGVPSDGGKTWTYKHQQGVKFEDGTAVTSAGRQVRRARSLDKDGAAQRPDLLQRLPRPAGGYTGPYKDTART